MGRNKGLIPPDRPKANLAAGHTYFGQFIDHDLTLDETPLPEALSDPVRPRDTRNRADARLSLDHLYGAGPGSARDGHLYDIDGASFLLGRVRSRLTHEPFDFPVNSDRPQSADPRNLDNIILRQLCGLFLKLHNVAVRELSPRLAAEERFARARTRVCWQYQWLVRECYLAAVIDQSVYQEVIREGRRKIDWQGEGFSIPIEFTQAAFRFGHSMVRPEYDLNRFAQKVSLQKIFAGPERRRALDPNQAIEWKTFFDPNRKPAMSIDTALVLPLFQLPSELAHHVIDPFAQPLPPELPVRTLQRGAASQLATGEEVTQALGCAGLREKSFPWREEPWRELDALGLEGRTPLWYYLLLEAELEQNGRRLGTVGSYLIAETIEGALRGDPASYLSCCGTDWSPPPWKTPKGDEVFIRKLADGAAVAGLIPPLH